MRRRGVHRMIYSPSANYVNDIKLKNMEKTLNNYGHKINEINLRYNDTLRNQKKEIDKLRNEMENSINLTHHSRIINDRNNTDDISDENEQKSLNGNLLHDLKISIPSQEGIRNEFINSQVNKIKNSDNNKNYNQ